MHRFWPSSVCMKSCGMCVMNTIHEQTLGTGKYLTGIQIQDPSPSYATTGLVDIIINLNLLKKLKYFGGPGNVQL